MFVSRPCGMIQAEFTLNGSQDARAAKGLGARLRAGGARVVLRTRLRGDPSDAADLSEVARAICPDTWFVYGSDASLSRFVRRHGVLAESLGIALILDNSSF